MMTATRTTRMVNSLWKLLLPWRDAEAEAATRVRALALIERAEAARLAYIKATQRMLRK